MIIKTRRDYRTRRAYKQARNHNRSVMRQWRNDLAAATQIPLRYLPSVRWLSNILIAAQELSTCFKKHYPAIRAIHDESVNG